MPLRYAECRRRGGRFCACLRSIFPCVGGRDGSGFPGVRSSHKKHPPGDRGGLYCFAGERRDLRSRVPCDCFFFGGLGDESGAAEAVGSTPPESDAYSAPRTPSLLFVPRSDWMRAFTGTCPERAWGVPRLWAAACATACAGREETQEERRRPRDRPYTPHTTTRMLLCRCFDGTGELCCRPH